MSLRRWPGDARSVVLCITGTSRSSPRGDAQTRHSTRPFQMAFRALSSASHRPRCASARRDLALGRWLCHSPFAHCLDLPGLSLLAPGPPTLAPTCPAAWGPPGASQATEKSVRSAPHLLLLAVTCSCLSPSSTPQCGAGECVEGRPLHGEASGQCRSHPSHRDASPVDIPEKPASRLNTLPVDGRQQPALTAGHRAGGVMVSPNFSERRSLAGTCISHTAERHSRVSLLAAGVPLL